MEKPTIGRIVHFVLENGQHRPAIVVHVNSDGTTNLQVFLDGPNDSSVVGAATVVGFFAWKTSAVNDEAQGVLRSYEPGTWHWPERGDT